MLSSTYNKVPYSILQNEVTKSFNNYISSGKHEHVQTDLYLNVKFGFKNQNHPYERVVCSTAISLSYWPALKGH